MVAALGGKKKRPVGVAAPKGLTKRHTSINCRSSGVKVSTNGFENQRKNGIVVGRKHLVIAVAKWCPLRDSTTTTDQ